MTPESGARCRRRKSSTLSLNSRDAFHQDSGTNGPCHRDGAVHTKGRIGDYDDDDVDERDRPAAVVYFGDMLQVAPEAIVYAKLREVAPDDLLFRRKELQEILFPVQDDADQALTRKAAFAELLLVERLL